MTTRTKLQLKPVAPSPAPALAVEITPTPIERLKVDRPDREGKKLIAGHFPESISRRLKILAATEGRTVQSLLDEALTDLFAKYGR